MYLLKKHTRLSLAKIGELTGGKDHSTVLHACKAVMNHMEIEFAYRDEMIRLEGKIKKLFRQRTVLKPSLSDKLREITGYQHRINMCIALNELRVAL